MSDYPGDPFGCTCVICRHAAQTPRSVFNVSKAGVRITHCICGPCLSKTKEKWVENGWKEITQYGEKEIE